MDRGAWWTPVHEVAKSRTQLSAQVCTHSHTHKQIYAHNGILLSHKKKEVLQLYQVNELGWYLLSDNSDRGQIQYDITYLKNLKIQLLNIIKNETDSNI